MSELWQLITLLITTVTTGGFTFFFTIRSVRKKEGAKAKQEEEKAIDHNISNTERIIRLYKEAALDVKELSEREKTLMAETIKTQDQKIAELKTQLDENRTLIDALTTQIRALTREIDRLKSEGSFKCPYKDNCKKYNNYIHKNTDSNDGSQG